MAGVGNIKADGNGRVGAARIRRNAQVAERKGGVGKPKAKGKLRLSARRAIGAIADKYPLGVFRVFGTGRDVVSVESRVRPPRGSTNSWAASRSGWRGRTALVPAPCPLAIRHTRYAAARGRDQANHSSKRLPPAVSTTTVCGLAEVDGLDQNLLPGREAESAVMAFTLGGLVEADRDHGDIGHSRNFPYLGNKYFLSGKHGQSGVNRFGRRQVLKANRHGFARRQVDLGALGFPVAGEYPSATAYRPHRAGKCHRELRRGIRGNEKLRPGCGRCIEAGPAHREAFSRRLNIIAAPVIDCGHRFYPVGLAGQSAAIEFLLLQARVLALWIGGKSAPREKLLQVLKARAPKHLGVGARSIANSREETHRGDGRNIAAAAGGGLSGVGSWAR